MLIVVVVCVDETKYERFRKHSAVRPMPGWMNDGAHETLSSMNHSSVAVSGNPHA